MKTKSIFLYCLLFLSINFFSQNIPVIKIGEKKISVKKLKIGVTVIGDIAITTYDMQFYNPNKRILEGELSFPLEENQSVVRFALDINGNLREAVVVEKEKGRVAFETTVRNRIDPALLEKTKGNNYKARIYPIPAKGYKRVVVAFQQKLIVSNNSYYYKIPFNYKEKLEDFEFTMKILNQKNRPVFTNGFTNSFNYNRKDNLYHLQIKSKKQKISKPAIIKIPIDIKEHRVIGNKEYFYYTKHIDFRREEEKLANNITIFWDKSLSQKKKKLQSDLDFLDKYFKKVLQCRVKLVVFNTKIRDEKSYEITGGSWPELRQKLKNIVYDGASSFDFLENYIDDSHLNLLFTDGLNTYSSFTTRLKKKTNIINSASSANHARLEQVASLTGGSYVNLKQVSIKDAFQRISKTQLQFLGTSISEDSVEIYPQKGSTVQNSFSLSGKGNVFNRKVKLFFGNSTDTIKTISFVLKRESQHSFIRKIWAEKKLKFLSKDKENNKDEIVSFSKKHNVTSSFTSMLILDRVEDYVAHEIEPPLELKKEYDELVARKVNDKKQRLANLKESTFKSFEDFFRWYDKDYKSKVTSQFRNPKQKVDTTALDSVLLINEYIVAGVVSGDNSVLPGVSVIVKNKNRGTTTDFDGKFSINIENGDVLLFSYLGFKTKEILVGNQSNINVTLENDDSVLDEIVVVGYGRVKRKRGVTGSVTIVNSESVTTSLTGRVSGVNISNSRANSNFLIRGKTSIVNSSKLNRIKYGKNKKGVNLKGWSPKTPYLKVLKQIKNTDKAYKEYIKLRSQYFNSPSFYIDVADFFKERESHEIANQILSNVAEIDLENYELLRALAYKLEEYKLYSSAVFIYKEILKLRPEDIQSYRDLALAYEANKKYQKALDILYKIVNGELLLKDETRRFRGVEVIALNELNRIISLYKTKLELNHIEDRYLKDLSEDIKVVIDWNHNDTDIDLWVIDPNKEKCYYGHKKTKIGGLMSDDMTQGFGPEQFVLKKAKKGTYKIKVKYYSSNQQKISGPTFLKVTVFKNYSKLNETKDVRLIRLKKTKDTIDVGEIIF